MNRRAFIGAIAAVLAAPKRLFSRNTLVTPEWVYADYVKLYPTIVRNKGTSTLTILGMMGEQTVLGPGESFTYPSNH